MKKYLLILTLLLGSLPALKAQDDQPGDDNKKQERIKALYVAYITQQLNLNPDEAQKFWPVHTQFEADLKAVRPELPELEMLRENWLNAGTLEERKRLATEIQMRFFRDVPHVPLGQYFGVSVFQKNIVDVQRGWPVMHGVRRV